MTHRGLTLIVLTLLAVCAACSRTHYRLRADRESYGTLSEKIGEAPWQLPSDAGVTPDPRSRFFDPTPSDDPQLPIPAPRLYSYALPALTNRRTPTPAGEPSSDGSSRQAVSTVSYQQPADANSSSGTSAQVSDDEDYVPDAAELRVPPLPDLTWQNMPEVCLRRMFEFASVRTEYERTYGQGPPDARRDDAQRLTFEDIVELARINSREYQAQKELLYRVALRLTLERFDYDLRFSPFGNRVTSDYRHARSGGTTVNSLLAPTRVSGEKMLASGGNILARFANDVVLTFNGPSGFASDIGSELLLDLSQSVIQRDIQFESLTQAERDLVYAARDFARFRKSFFRNLASQYYNLLLSFRAIEIGSQDYFSTTRAFYQGEAEFRAARLPRVQVDQLEQNSLSSRSRLIATCNSLESDLDGLKIVIGLPTETPINLNLSELESLTLRDEASVLGERVRRARRALQAEHEQSVPDHGVLINGALGLSERMADFSRLQRQLGDMTWDPAQFDRVRRELLVTEAHLLVEFNRVALDQARNAQPPAPPLRVFQRLIDLIDSQRLLVQRRLDVLRERNGDTPDITQALERLRMLDAADRQLRKDLQTAEVQQQLDRIPQLVADAETLLAGIQELSDTTRRLFDATFPTPIETLERTRQVVSPLLATSQEMLSVAQGGLTPVEIDMDAAMLTALTLRYDLMNERGNVADRWRRIKLAGDDLRSILNLNATQSVRTRADVNRPFDFTWDESNTRVALTFDTPLNRKAQRNAYRSALIDYQRSLRDLMAFEDNIKLQIRDDLRQLSLNREQYNIAVASAALAFERVISTRLQLQLGIQNVAARDFLEAQQAYTASLSSVASVHIRYLLGRIQLFLDSELMQLDDDGFWRELGDDSYQPQPQYAPPPGVGRAYGDLPDGVWYSRQVRRMLEVPEGEATIEMHLPPATEDVAPGPLAPRE